MNAIGGGIMALGLMAVTAGMIGMFRFRQFYARVLISSNIDGAGALLILTGITLRSPDIAFALKVVVIAVLLLVTSPMATHAILRSARGCGLRMKSDETL